ncbi:ras-related protein Rab-9A-like [Amphiura filiformis]|uniref:ras-related protein Rab-9A-like n=1 Tax=Amphiura filiformis TaxID=82378 RepID=UPI003B226A06
MRSITRSYYQHTHAAILVYAVDDIQSYRDLIEWENDLREYETTKTSVFRFLVGNKTDLDMDTRIDTQIQGDIEAFCREHNVNQCFMTSAKTGDGIEDVFKHIANRLAPTTHRRWSTANTDTVDLGLQTKTYITDSSSCRC